ncbi:unnamed protein product [Brassica rapa subsp. trilocularis]|uniref:Uncharacterized protein n=1 Tax=Brassica campestris TaxID=3711 RepID=A0A3P5YEA9_BRACM|nr:unnamed protein product [Brassica rapa]
MEGIKKSWRKLGNSDQVVAVEVELGKLSQVTINEPAV